jgi:membrane-bound lytic murein transglycosylase B
MFSILKFFLVVLYLLGILSFGPAIAAEQVDSFSKWLVDFQKEAKERGIPKDFLEITMNGLQPIKRVVELDRRQPEFTLTFWRYLNNAINEKRIRQGKEVLKKHHNILKKVANRFGVSPRFIAAFWGLETNYGEYTGKFPVIGAVATLAHDRRRSSFFRAQLFAALTIMSRGDVDHQIRGSWAGAMGNFQFIPSTYKDFAVDADGDGKRDMWNSYPDMFSSAANYLSKSGWQQNWTWGREVKLSDEFKLELSGLNVNKPLSFWRAIGVRRMDGIDLPDLEAEASIILPAGYNGPAFLVYNNFKIILKWNRSILYAIAVGHLADRIGGSGPLKTKPPKVELRLSIDDIKELQRLLSALGFEVGGPDGIVGPNTRIAIKAYQNKAKLPADGFPTMDLIERIRSKSSLTN